jgi:hypothetical protein
MKELIAKELGLTNQNFLFVESTTGIEMSQAYPDDLILPEQRKQIVSNLSLPGQTYFVYNESIRS